MENVMKQYNIKGWEYYLAWTLSIIGTLAVVLAALRVFGVI
jgi:hypothetical protein